MADPFDALRLKSAPVGPDPLFAERLRSRLLRTFDLPKGVTVSNLAVEETGPVPAPPTRGAVSVVPYLAVAGARDAIEWYQEALGAELQGSPIVMPDGRIGHAELTLGDGGLIMLSEEHPEIGVGAPSPGGTVPVSIHLSVPDVDSLIARAVAAGARPEREVADYEYGRNGAIRDPFGHRWLIMTEPAPRFRHGDVGYASLWVRDADRAARFFAAVLGWRCDPNERGEGWTVTGLTLHHGIHASPTASGLFLCYAVADVAEAIAAVGAAGGAASEPVQEPWGATVDCTDVDGLPFAVFAPPGGVARTGARTPANGRLPGDLAYITMLTGGSGPARAFYSSVLGWNWQPGRVADGWGAEDAVPMTGLSGGHDRTFVMPMYRVDDIASAVARVRAFGGTATDPEQQPYGITAECEDDQGTRFYLGQL